jgi:hypothetical protein
MSGRGTTPSGQGVRVVAEVAEVVDHLDRLYARDLTLTA